MRTGALRVMTEVEVEVEADIRIIAEVQGTAAGFAGMTGTPGASVIAERQAAAKAEIAAGAETEIATGAAGLAIQATRR